jgi:hypothetical protein
VLPNTRAHGEEAYVLAVAPDEAIAVGTKPDEAMLTRFLLIEEAQA